MSWAMISVWKLLVAVKVLVLRFWRFKVLPCAVETHPRLLTFAMLPLSVWTERFVAFKVLTVAVELICAPLVVMLRATIVE